MAGENYLWDSCVFIAWLKGEKDSHDIESVGQFLKDAQRRDCTIFASSVIFAEITPKHLHKSRYGDWQNFMRDFQSAIEIVTATPDICALAGELRDFPYEKKGANKRILTTFDAIILATALVLDKHYAVPITALHSFDLGRSKSGPDTEKKRAVPIVGLEDWCENLKDQPRIQQVLSIPRCKPEHNMPELDI